MVKLLLELALFFRPKITAIWSQILYDWAVKKVRDEYIDLKIEKYERDNNKLKSLLELERERRRSVAKKLD